MGYKWDGNLLTSKRGIDQYSMVLGITLEDLYGKDVLDIGAGAGLFGKECSKHGINVVSLDPSYSLPEREIAERKHGDMDISKYLRRKANRKGKIVGVNEALSFKDESFDMVLSTFASYFYIQDNYPEERHDEIFELFTGEILRVLKRGGEARIGQICFHQRK